MSHQLDINNTTNKNEDDILHLHDDDDSDDLILQHVETTYEKSVLRMNKTISTDSKGNSTDQRSIPSTPATVGTVIKNRKQRGTFGSGFGLTRRSSTAAVVPTRQQQQRFRTTKAISSIRSAVNNENNCNSNDPTESSSATLDDDDIFCNNNKTSIHDMSANKRRSKYHNQSIHDHNQYDSDVLVDIEDGNNNDNNSNDDDDDGGSNTFFDVWNDIPSDLRVGNTNSSNINDMNNNIDQKFANHHRYRSVSSETIPTRLLRSPLRLIRASTMTTTSSSSSLHVAPPQRPKMSRRLQRSHSMALGMMNDTTTTTDDNNDYFNQMLWNEDIHPLQELDAVEKPSSPLTSTSTFNRKLVRAQQQPHHHHQLHRRHSLSLIPFHNHHIPQKGSDLTRTSSTSTSTISSATTNDSLSSSSNLKLMMSTSMTSVTKNIDELDETLFSCKSSNNINDENKSSNMMNSSSNLSPEPNSIASSTNTTRKRGVSSSSVSDLDEYIQLSGGSISSCKRRNHTVPMTSSSSLTLSEQYHQQHLRRMFTLPPGQVLPPAPPLSSSIDDYSFITNATQHNNSINTTRNDESTTVPSKTCMNNNIDTEQTVQHDFIKVRSSSNHIDESMDYEEEEDTDNERQSDQNVSIDTSFEVIKSCTTHVNLTGGGTTAPSMQVDTLDDDEMKIKCILDTMPSIDDLTFLINELKKEEIRSKRVIILGAGKIWKIVPPFNHFEWTTQRRTIFLNWTKVTLGFTPQSVGMGLIVVQINKTRGQQLIDVLERSKLRFLSANEDEESSKLVHPLSSSSNVLGQHDASKLLFTTSIDAVPMLSNQTAPLRRHKISKSPLKMDTDTDELAAKISSLSMTTSNSTRSSGPFTNGKSSLISTKMQLTTQVEENISISNILYNDVAFQQERLSIDNNMGMSRPSFDNHVKSEEFTQHLYAGHSPRLAKNSRRRPPKVTTSSMSYIGSSESANKNPNCGAVRTSKTPLNTDSVCFVTTPLMTKDRGWGSRPIVGRDWGNSEQCEYSIIQELVARLELYVDMEGSTMPINIDHYTSDSLSQLDFDLEADCINQTGYIKTAVEICNIPSDRDVDRLNKKKLSTYNKMKRQSVIASAFVGMQSHVQMRKSFFPTNLMEIDTIEEVSVPTIRASEQVGQIENVITTILSFLNESELMSNAFPVCKAWSDYATMTHVNLLTAGIHCVNLDGECGITSNAATEPILEKSWDFLHTLFPWACFLAEGGAKKVYNVYNASVEQNEALSVMDTQRIDNIQIVINELTISAMVSSLVRRGVCPNFVSIHGVFTCAYEPPASIWGNERKKKPRGAKYDKKAAPCRLKTPKEKHPGRFQYIRMELINEGDAEELIKRQKQELFPTSVSRSILFQVAFSLFAAAEKFSIKHYDVKLLNVFIQNTHSAGDLVLRYGVGSHTFALRLPSSNTYIAKLADFGTANMEPFTNGLPLTISHFTTLENTPPDYLILGDCAEQGHGHDNFGLGLVMLHLFTGFRPYEEILEDVKCPPCLKDGLRLIWENDSISDYSVIRSVIMDGVDIDDNGNMEGTPDDTLYDTFYRYLVLFGIPKTKFQEKKCAKVWKAINDALVPPSKVGRKKTNSDSTIYKRDCKKYSIRMGNNKYIARARQALTSLDGGLELLFQLCNFDPSIRATAIDVLNSKLMEDLREPIGYQYDSDTDIRSYMSFSTSNNR